MVAARSAGWSIVESRRYARHKVAHRHVRYLGEINDSQHLAWERTIAAHTLRLDDLFGARLPVSRETTDREKTCSITRQLRSFARDETLVAHTP